MSNLKYYLLVVLLVGLYVSDLFQLRVHYAN
ncbi:ABC transporter permease [Edwardsiella phage ETP-1]|uniref:ABC transporter permease n=1 Tax=Edwardsiella phage ETP-1 TaxID=2544920 RepID=A0A6G5P4B4_9CAUD|nr:ABC transporter permease [Edwardsiella phage ETP-1]